MRKFIIIAITVTIVLGMAVCGLLVGISQNNSNNTEEVNNIKENYTTESNKTGKI